MNTRWLRIDASFPGERAEQLVEMLGNGWYILDKTVTGDRYISYLLGEKADSDVGKCSPLEKK